MSTVESNNYWDGIVNGVNSEEFANILNILDFPMESLEGDGVAGDLDPSNFQNMGPIPLEALTGVPAIPQGQVVDAPEKKVSSRNAPINMKSERIEPENDNSCSNGRNTPCDSFISLKFRTFGAPSPVSILESGGSCSSGKLLTTKSEILESVGSCSSGNPLPTKPETDIPGRARSKRKRPSNLHPWFKISPISCSGYVANRSLNSGNNIYFNKRRLFESSNVSVGLENPSRPSQPSRQAANKFPEGTYAMKKKDIPDRQHVLTKKCTHCEVTKTPQWREGPLGRNTLCNACGVRYRSGRLHPEYRPASSPTFVPSVHSNLRKKVEEMRKKATQQDIEAEIPPVSPPPEFVPMSNNLFDPLFQKRW